MAALGLRERALDFSLLDLEGNAVARGDYEGRPLAVVFSCCHCPYVIAWEDRINALAREYGDRAGIVAINSNAGYLGDSPEDMRRRAEQKRFAFPFLYDESQQIARAYGANRTPEVFVFDDSHRLVYHGAPDSDHRDPGGAEPHFRRALEAALAGSEPDVTETPPVGCTIKWR